LELKVYTFNPDNPDLMKRICRGKLEHKNIDSYTLKTIDGIMGIFNGDKFIQFNDNDFFIVCPTETFNEVYYQISNWKKC